MYEKSLIAIFDSSLRVTGFIPINETISFEETSFCDEDTKIKLNNLVLTLNSSTPRIRSEIVNNGVVSINLEPTKDKSKTMTAVLEEIKIAGFIAKIIPNFLKKTLIYISLKLTPEQRESILGDLVNPPFDLDEKTLEEFRDILIDFETEKIIKNMNK